MAQWPVVDDCLVVGGVPLTRLAQRVGRTPCYAYDRVGEAGIYVCRVDILFDRIGCGHA